MPIHTLIVNDSKVASQIIYKILASSAEFEPIVKVEDGIQAEAYLEKSMPDVILMDIHMPHQDGVQTTRNILQKVSVPILVVTSTVKGNMRQVFQCMSYGALDAIKLPNHAEFRKIHNLAPDYIQELGADFIRKVKTIAWAKMSLATSNRVPEAPQLSPHHEEGLASSNISASELIAVGASAGGPEALTVILGRLPADFSGAMVILQHISVEFLPGLIEYLKEFSKLPIKAAVSGERPMKGTIYYADQNECHLSLASDRTFVYTKDQKRLHAPSIDVLFESVAQTFGKHGIGVLLSGMGKDGAIGMKSIKNAHGLTLAQNQETCAIFGMPKAAIEQNAAMRVLDVKQIATQILVRLKEFDFPFY